MRNWELKTSRWVHKDKATCTQGQMYKSIQLRGNWASNPAATLCARKGALPHNLHKVVMRASSGSSVQVDECGQTHVLCKGKNEGNEQQWWELCSSREKERGSLCLGPESINCFVPAFTTTSSTSCPRIVGDAIGSFWGSPLISFNEWTSVSCN